MTRHRPIFNRCRSLTDRYEVLDSPRFQAIRVHTLCSTDRAFGSKVTKQLFLKNPAGLNKETAIDRLV